MFYRVIPKSFQVCQSAGKKCNMQQLQLLNSCEALRESYPCSTCKPSNGREQPAYVSPAAEAKYGPGECLVNAGTEEPTTCDASHPSTFRLCACE